jgi:quercetin dioxygenase-like cupin family protein
MDISRSGSQPSRWAPKENFTGTVRVDPLFQPPGPSRSRGSSVTFEPGARTGWHKHPFGQALIVTAGCGRVQCEGQPVQEIRPGDVVWIAPGEMHWHGAAELTSMTHIAIAEHDHGLSAEWGALVTDEQYRGTDLKKA